MPDTPQQRFLKLDQVGEELNITPNQVYALVRRGDLEAIKIGGRGQWRVERDRLEEYIQRTYAETRAFIEAHPIREDATPELGVDEDRELRSSRGTTSPAAKPTEPTATKRPVASSQDLMSTPPGDQQSRPASLVDRARSHVDNDTPINRPSDPGLGGPEPATIRQPGL